MLIQLFRVNTMEDLVSRIKGARTIERCHFQNRAKQLFSGDSELIATSAILSLQCPLSLAKIRIPARGSNCKHLQVYYIR